MGGNGSVPSQDTGQMIGQVLLLGTQVALLKLGPCSTL